MNFFFFLISIGPTVVEIDLIVGSVEWHPLNATSRVCIWFLQFVQIFLRDSLSVCVWAEFAHLPACRIMRAYNFVSLLPLPIMWTKLCVRARDVPSTRYNPSNTLVRIHTIAITITTNTQTRSTFLLLMYLSLLYFFDRVQALAPNVIIWLQIKIRIIIITNCGHNLYSYCMADSGTRLEYQISCIFTAPNMNRCFGVVEKP